MHAPLNRNHNHHHPVSSLVEVDRVEKPVEGHLIQLHRQRGIGDGGIAEEQPSGSNVTGKEAFARAPGGGSWRMPGTPDPCSEAGNTATLAEAIAEAIAAGAGDRGANARGDPEPVRHYSPEAER